MEWYKITETNGVYLVNKEGWLLNTNTNNITKGSLTSQGYRELRYRVQGATVYRRLVHVILAEMFLTKPEGDYVVDHKNNKKEDNELDNLHYVLRSYNGAKGQEVRDASTLYKAVAQYTLEGSLVAEYKSIKEACEALGVKRSPLIGYACRGRCSTNNCNTAYGYKWKFIDDDIVQPPQ